MNIKKKILAITICPVLVLGIVSMLFINTLVRNSVMDEIEDALKGTAAATLAAYDQNTGDYMKSSNGDIWKGSYNISKSESLVDRIKSNTGMDVTFFYGDERIMTSAVDADGNRILGSKAGDKIVEKVLNGGEEYFSHAVSIEGTINYGYFMPVYQNDSDSQIVGMVFVGTNKQEKDAVLKHILSSIGASVGIIMLICIAVGIKLATGMSKNIKNSVELVGRMAGGDLNVWVDDKLLKKKDEIGDLSRVTVTLRDAMQSTIKEITSNAKALLDASQLLGTAADNTNGTMNDVRMAVSQVVDNSQAQAEKSKSTSEHMKIMGDNITEASREAELLNDNAASMQLSSEKASKTLIELRSINEDVKRIINDVKEQTNRTNESVKKIQTATTFINSIAEDTSLLSLNASIEAARAGEAGRGFAVVAENIKQLAEQTTSSAADIQDIIHDLEQKSGETVEKTEAVNNIVNKQSEDMKQTADILNQVITGITGLIDKIDSIAVSVANMDKSKENVVDVIGNLSSVSQENAASTEETSASTTMAMETAKKIADEAVKLKDIAQELEDRMKQFIIQ